MTITVLAPAKLTVSLRITGVRDDGYHLIDAEMVTLDLADVLTIDPAGDSLTVGGTYGGGIPVDDGNLVAVAFRMAGRKAGVHIDKRIPPGGGLGGGSADAAAVLRWAGVTDLDVAVRIGADVPFCVVGGRATVTGIGEIVSPLPQQPRTFTLVIPPLSCSTPAVYRAWDELQRTADRRFEAVAINDLEAAAIVVEPRLLAWRSRIEAIVGHPPTLAGSGATWFVEGRHPELIDALADARVVITDTTS